MVAYWSLLRLDLRVMNNSIYFNKLYSDLNPLLCSSVFLYYTVHHFIHSYFKVDVLATTTSRKQQWFKSHQNKAYVHKYIIDASMLAHYCTIRRRNIDLQGQTQHHACQFPLSTISTKLHISNKCFTSMTGLDLASQFSFFLIEIGMFISISKVYCINLLTAALLPNI